MDLLLDTCAFIWWDGGGGSLTPAAHAAIADPTNPLFLSLASLWEMQLKHQLGKLPLRQPLPVIVEEQRRRNGLQLLAIEPAHIFGLSSLPFHHRDPFDRLIISQALLGGMTVITDDPEFPKYAVPVLR